MAITINRSPQRSGSSILSVYPPTSQFIAFARTTILNPNQFTDTTISTAMTGDLVLITGATGHIGFRTLRYLLEYVSADRDPMQPNRD
jgi:hypothetical protein